MRAETGPHGEAFRCGAVAVLGRPNAGKSTLVNALVGERVSITSSKPQTTRHAIRGILTTADAQYVFVDTPGFQTAHRGPLNRLMNRSVRSSAAQADAAILVIEAGKFLPEDTAALAAVPQDVPRLLAVNKIDRLSREALASFLCATGALAQFAQIVPVSAARRRNLGELLKVVRRYLPEGPPMYPEDEFVDRDERFLAAERIREKLFRQLGDEVPYGSGVTIERFEHAGRLRRIHATIVVEKEGHKAIVIGAGGAKLKSIASEARTELEALFGGRVYLGIWVKVRTGWTRDETMLRRLGYA